MILPSIDLLRRFVSEYPEYELQKYLESHDYYIVDTAHGEAFIKVTFDSKGFISDTHVCDVTNAYFPSFSRKLDSFLASECGSRSYTPTPLVTPYSHIPEYLDQMAPERRFYPPTARIFHSLNIYGYDVITVTIASVSYVKATIIPTGDAYINFIRENVNNTRPVIALLALRILLTECLPPHDLVLPSVGVKTLPPIVIGG